MLGGAVLIERSRATDSNSKRRTLLCINCSETKRNRNKSKGSRVQWQHVYRITEECSGNSISEQSVENPSEVWAHILYYSHKIPERIVQHVVVYDDDVLSLKQSVWINYKYEPDTVEKLPRYRELVSHPFPFFITCSRCIVGLPARLERTSDQSGGSAVVREAVWSHPETVTEHIRLHLALEVWQVW